MTSYCCVAGTCDRCVAARKQRAEWDANIALAELTWGEGDGDQTIADICTSADESLKDARSAEHIAKSEEYWTKQEAELVARCGEKNARLLSRYERQ